MQWDKFSQQLKLDPSYMKRVVKAVGKKATLRLANETTRQVGRQTGEPDEIFKAKLIAFIGCQAGWQHIKRHRLELYTEEELKALRILKEEGRKSHRAKQLLRHLATKSETNQDYWRQIQSICSRN